MKGIGMTIREDLFTDELKRIKAVYSQRNELCPQDYNILYPHVYLNFQERERALIRWLNFAGFGNINQLKLLEIGCGFGDNLLEFIKLGFSPENLAGNDLIDERLEIAKKKLPESVKLFNGDASALNLPVENYDIVFQAMVFSSILNSDLQNELAKKMWSLVKPGGGILSYDLVYNNPKNSNISRFSKENIHTLFPSNEVKFWKITLAPPIARLVTKISSKLYSAVNLFPFMRTHLLCWIKKEPLIHEHLQ
jgi:ubiquinone/menaquinone biosynthesis C-methylase UbiE